MCVCVYRFESLDSVFFFSRVSTGSEATTDLNCDVPAPRPHFRDSLPLHLSIISAMEYFLGQREGVLFVFVFLSFFSGTFSPGSALTERKLKMISWLRSCQHRYDPGARLLLILTHGGLLHSDVAK